MDGIGGALEAERKRQGLTLRQLAGMAGVSASLLCSIEKGRVNPSVATLFEVATALGVRPQMFFEPARPAAVATGDSEGQLVGVARAAADPRSAVGAPEGAPEGSWVLHRDERPTIGLTDGVVWRLLSPQAGEDIEFFEVEYPAGASSGAEMFTHQGRELGLVLEGELTVEVGFERHVLGPGDSIGYESTTPHRIVNTGTTPMRAVWLNCKRAQRAT